MPHFLGQKKQSLNMNVKLKEITVDDRARFEMGDMEGLCDSILRLGLIHPIALDGENKLLAGGRRHAVLMQLYKNRADLTSDEIDPGIKRFLDSGELELGIHYTSKADSNINVLDEIELEENVRRKSFTWKEQVLAIAKVHELKQIKAILEGERWGQQQTGELLGVSHASISYALTLRDHLRDPKSPIQKCSSATDALHLLTQIRKEEAQKELVNRTIPQYKVPQGKEVSMDDLIKSFPGKDAKDLLRAGLGRIEVNEPEVEDVDKDKLVIRLSEFVHHGDFLDLYKGLPKVNHIITDPPYGIDMNNLGNHANLMEGVKDTHEVDENILNFQPWLQAMYEWMDDHGFCIVFCDFVHFNRLRLMADQVGFKAQRWPFIWCKTHMCSNQAADFNFTKNVEIALVLRKGAATLVKPQPTSYLMASSLPTKKELSGHPFVKPLDVWQHLAKAVAIEGQTIGDPFSGVGSMPRALLDAGYRVITCEISEEYYNQQITNLMNYYNGVFNNEVVFK